MKSLAQNKNWTTIDFSKNGLVINKRIKIHQNKETPSANY
jgi:hypothetical protein